MELNQQLRAGTNTLEMYGFDKNIERLQGR